MFRSEEGWVQAYQQKDALWIHDGNAARPHALLTSGRHSNGFFNSRRVIPDEKMLREAASDQLDHFVAAGGDLAKIDGVVGPQTGATLLAQYLSEEITVRTGRPCFFVSPAKHEDDGVKSMVFTPDELALVKGKILLPCEDVLTTGESVDLAVDAVLEAEGATVSWVLALVNRSGRKSIGGHKIVALIERDMPMWEDEECPLCKKGSKAIRPKEPEDWARLNAKY